MFLYVCERALDHDVDEIHEQEVGRQVFGRPADYDTSADNTVRVHASMLRKRVDQYFAKEGSHETLIIEIPRGNYAPVFLERPAPLDTPEPPPHALDTTPVDLVNRSRHLWQIWLPLAMAVVFAALACSLYVQNRHLRDSGVMHAAPTVKQFWSQVFQVNRPTDVVLGDAALALYEERTARQVNLSEYFDRSYLNAVGERAGTSTIDPDLAKALLLKRHTSYGDVALLSVMTEIAHAEHSDTRVRFARDYSFREIKSDNAILLGSIRSDPWMEPFQEHQTLHWSHNSTGGYYPLDSTAPASDQERYHPVAQPGEPPVGYAIVSLFPNMGGTGSVLTISGTGGTAMNGALAFLSDEHMMAQLHAQLNLNANAPFPWFEALLKIGSRNTLPRDTSILIVRRLRS
jgi:hypothetical protein